MRVVEFYEQNEISMHDLMKRLPDGVLIMSHPSEGLKFVKGHASDRFELWGMRFDEGVDYYETDMEMWIRGKLKWVGYEFFWFPTVGEAVEFMRKRLGVERAD